MTPWAVIGGTPVDSRLGHDALRREGIDSRQYPLSGSSSYYEQILADPRKAADRVRTLVEQIRRDGLTKVFAYCNSLASVVDLVDIATSMNLRLVSPLHAYEAAFTEDDHVSRVAIFAGNGPGVVGITKILDGIRPSLRIFGFSLLQVVQDIEANLHPRAVIEKNSLEELDSFLASQVDVVVLGCTHFNVLKDDLQTTYTSRVFDPTEKMIKLLYDEKGI